MMCFWKKRCGAGSVTEFMEEYYGSADKTVLHGRIEGTMVCILYEAYQKFCERKDAKVLSLRKFIEGVKTEYVLTTERVDVQSECDKDKAGAQLKFVKRD